MAQPDFDRLTKHQAQRAQLTEPINIELHFGETEQWVIREALLEYAEGERSEGVRYIIDKTLNVLTSTLTDSVK